jgi:hypothetical protein
MPYSSVDGLSTFGQETHMRLYADGMSGHVVPSANVTFELQTTHCCAVLDSNNRRRAWTNFDNEAITSSQASRIEVVEKDTLGVAGSYECLYFRTEAKNLQGLVVEAPGSLDGSLDSVGDLGSGSTDATNAPRWRLCSTGNPSVQLQVTSTEAGAAVHSLAQCEAFAELLGVPFDPYYGIDTCNLDDYQALGNTLVCAYHAREVLGGPSPHACGPTTFPNTGRVVAFPAGRVFGGTSLWTQLAQQTGTEDAANHGGTCSNAAGGCRLPFKGSVFGLTVYPASGAWCVRESTAFDYLAHTVPIFNANPRRLYSMYPMSVAPPPPLSPGSPPPPSAPVMPHCINAADGTAGPRVLIEVTESAVAPLLSLDGTTSQQYAIENGKSYDFTSTDALYFSLDYTHVVGSYSPCAIQVGFLNWPAGDFVAQSQSEYASTDPVLAEVSPPRTWAIKTDGVCVAGTGVVVNSVADSPINRGIAFYIVDTCPPGPPPPPRPPPPPSPVPNPPPPPHQPYHTDCLSPTLSAEMDPNTLSTDTHSTAGGWHINGELREWTVRNGEVYEFESHDATSLIVDPPKNPSCTNPQFAHYDRERFEGTPDCQRKPRVASFIPQHTPIAAEFRFEFEGLHSGDFSAQTAADNCYDGDFTSDYCMSADPTGAYNYELMENYLQFDLGTTKGIAFVRIYNGAGTSEAAAAPGYHTDRLAAHKIIIGDFPNDPLNVVHTSCDHTAPDEIGPFDEECVGAGRYVYIYVEARAGNRITLREVEFFAPNTSPTIQTNAENAVLPTGTSPYTIAVDYMCEHGQIPTGAKLATMWSFGSIGTNTLNRLYMSSTQIVHDLGNDLSAFTFSTGNDVCDGEFHELVVTSDGTTRKMFWDGGEVASKAAAAGADRYANLCMGGEQNVDETRVDRAWQGFVSDFKVWAVDLSGMMECKCLVHTGQFDYPNSHMEVATAGTVHSAGDQITLRVSGCATGTGVRATGGTGGDRGVIMHVTSQCPVSAPPPPPLQCEDMPYSATTDKRAWVASTGELTNNEHVLWQVDSGGVTTHESVSFDLNIATAYTRCCNLCRMNNNNHRWVFPPSDTRSPETNKRQCRQFQVVESSVTVGSFSCRFYSFDLGDSPTAYADPQASDHTASHVYSALPFAMGSSTPHPPPAPHPPPPPYQAASLPALECDDYLQDLQGYTKVCKYYYTPKCHAPTWGLPTPPLGQGISLCGGEADTASRYCDDGFPKETIDAGDTSATQYCHKQVMTGYVPSAASALERPLYFYHPGEGGTNCKSVEVQHFLGGMAARGYAPFCVTYPRSNNIRYSEGWYDQKAQWIYSDTNPRNALSVACSQPGVDCHKGVGTHGYSQGAHIASLAKKHYSGITGILGFGAGCLSKVTNDGATGAAMGLLWDQSASLGSVCYQASYLGNAAHPTQTSQNAFRAQDIYRVINGIDDEKFGQQGQLVAHTGLDACADDRTDCLQSDGSGFYLVRHSENNGAAGDYHRFFANSNFELAHSFEHGSYQWSMNPNLDWLAAKATRMPLAPTGPIGSCHYFIKRATGTCPAFKRVWQRDTFGEAVSNHNPSSAQDEAVCTQTRKSELASECGLSEHEVLMHHISFAPPSPPPVAVGLEGQLCGYGGVAFRTCATGTECLVSDENDNPDTGTVTTRSHCCRDKVFGYMCKYMAVRTGVVEYCRDDNQCGYGTSKCSGAGTLPTNIKYGVCSTSWLPDRSDYASPSPPPIMTNATQYTIVAGQFKYEEDSMHSANFKVNEDVSKCYDGDPVNGNCHSAWSGSLDYTTASTWVMFDLGETKSVGEVVIYNGLGADHALAPAYNTEALGLHRITIGDFEKNPLHPSHAQCVHTAPNEVGPIEEECQGRGRYVYIFKDSAPNNYINLREVQVFSPSPLP